MPTAFANGVCDGCAGVEQTAAAPGIKRPAKAAQPRAIDREPPAQVAPSRRPFRFAPWTIVPVVIVTWYFMRSEPRSVRNLNFYELSVLVEIQDRQIETLQAVLMATDDAQTRAALTAMEQRAEAIRKARESAWVWGKPWW